MANLDRCVGSFNTLNDLCVEVCVVVCVPNKIEDFNLGVFIMLTGINESKVLCKSCKCEFDSRKCSSKLN